MSLYIDVCFLRLDFETFSIAGPASTDEGVADADSDLCQDTFDVTVSTGQNIPTICGVNTGQHSNGFYLIHSSLSSY